MLSAQCLSIIVFCSVVNFLSRFELEHGITTWAFNNLRSRHLQLQLLIPNFIQFRPQNVPHRILINHSVAMATLAFIEVTIWFLGEQGLLGILQEARGMGEVETILHEHLLVALRCLSLSDDFLANAASVSLLNDVLIES